jgi:hypothetical protein
VTLDETIDLLAVAAAFDRRTVGEADAMAWQAAIGGLDFGDSRAAIVAHYQDTRDWIMPADIRKRVKAARRDRLERAIATAPDAELTDEPGRYKAALAAEIRKIAAGRSLPKAIGGPVREDDPPPTWAEARAAMGEPPKLTPQEKALQQAAESRAEREAREADEDPAA